MLNCFECRRQIDPSQARMARMCHRVVYLCPECRARAQKNMAPARLNTTVLTENPQGSVSLQF